MRTRPSTFCDLIVGRSTVRSVDLGWLDLWAWVAGREGQLPGGFAVGDTEQSEQSLPRLAVSPVLGAFPFVIRGLGAVSSWDPESWRGFKRPIQVREFSRSGRLTQFSHLRRELGALKPVAALAPF